MCVTASACAESKSGLGKAAAAEVCGEARENYRPWQVRRTCAAKTVKKLTGRSTFGSQNVQQVYGAGAVSTFASQNHKIFQRRKTLNAEIVKH